MERAPAILTMNMDKNQAIEAIDRIYKLLVSDYIDHNRFSMEDEIWILEDYRNFLKTIKNSDWSNFGRNEIEMTDWINSRYFGRGEIALQYCPKVISYEEIAAAKNGLGFIMRHIQQIQK